MKVLYVDDDLFVFYECLPGGFQENGLCKRGKEHVAVFARRAYINSEEFARVDKVLHDRTCFSGQDLVMSNRTGEVFSCAQG